MTTLLIDADVLAYNAASANETATNWGDGYWTWHADEQATKDTLLASVDRLVDQFKATDIKLCLTDSENNFRKEVLPTYKHLRANIKKPLLLKHIKEWLIADHAAYFRPTLEGDDCMGILATMKQGGKRIIVSVDKDMQTIPCTFYRDGVAGAEVVEVSEQEADYYHMYQTLMGDSTDGYSGCPSVGSKTATKILDAALEGVGDDLTERSKAMWSAVVAAFKKAKLGEEEALRQARVARILRATDYDFKKKEPILWTPATYS